MYQFKCDNEFIAVIHAFGMTVAIVGLSLCFVKGFFVLLTRGALIGGDTDQSRNLFWFCFLGIVEQLIIR